MAADKTVNKLNQYMKEFDKCFFNMKYNECFEIVGQMEKDDIPDLRRLRCILYYETGQFAKIRNLLRGEKLTGTEETEFYLASLLELGLVDEYEKAAENAVRITLEGAMYIDVLCARNKHRMTNSLKVSFAPDFKSYFSRQYKWFVIYAVADIYSINEEKLRMIEASMSQESIDSLSSEIEKKFEQIINSPERENLYRKVQKNEHIRKEDVIIFLRYVAKRTKDGAQTIEFDNLYDVVHFLDFCRNINYEGMNVLAFGEYRDVLRDALKCGNQIAINLVQSIYLETKIISNDTEAGKDKSLSAYFRGLLKENAPQALNDIDRQVTDRDIENRLTIKGKFAYKAALWQFYSATDREYGTLDAGMLCLSYMRIIELEVNERIMIPLICDFYEDISEKYKSLIDNSSASECEKLDKNWGFVFAQFDQVKEKKKTAFEMGTLFAFFDKLHGRQRKQYNKTVVGWFMEALGNILSENGISSVQEGKLAEIFKKENRERFRNPPAHTRYVSFETALECKTFVEKSIVEIDSYIKADV